MEMPTTCAVCGQTFDLNDGRRSPDNPEITICRSCAAAQEECKEQQKLCQKCGEELEHCECCGAIGCPECDLESPFPEDSMIKYCPECAKGAREERVKEAANGTKICATCTRFRNENGWGDGDCDLDELCPHHDGHCDNWAPDVDKLIERVYQKGREKMMQVAITAFDNVWLGDDENGDGEWEPDYEYHRRNFVVELMRSK